MTTDTKLAAALQRITEEAAKITPESRQEILSALAECASKLKRAAKRAAPLPAEFEVVEIVQDRGPTIEFTGKLLCAAEFDTRKGESVVMDLWQTQGGATVGVMGGDRPSSAQVFQPDDYADAQAMQRAVMDFFAWDIRARSMVTKKLGWSLRRDVA